MATRLRESFAAVYVLLERPRAARRVVGGLIVFQTLLLGYSGYVHSPTHNEPAHLVAGISDWKFGRFDVYKVNPPLIRMVAALPPMAIGCNEDWRGFYEGPGARPELSMGGQFVVANGEHSYFLFMIARWACIPFSWLGMVVCFKWASQLYGRPSGVMAAMIWCFEPNILAHASLMTPDAHATALGLAACYTFWRWLKRPTWAQAAFTGIVLGLAELAKTTLILFYPLWPLMWLIYRWPDRCSMRAHDWLREAGMLAMRMVIGLYVLNLGYAFEGSFTRLKDFQFVSNLFTGSKSVSNASRDGSRRRTDDNPQPEIRNSQSINRFVDTWIGDLPIPVPKNYLLGIDIQQKDFEHYGIPSYLGGVWQANGWWYYYLYACAIKVPLGLWILGLLVLITRLSAALRHVRGIAEQGRSVLPERRTVTPVSPPLNSEGSGIASNFLVTTSDPRDWPALKDEFILIAPAIVIFSVVSSKTGFNEHMRYVLPAFPFFFIAVSQFARMLAIRRIDQATWLTPLRNYLYNHPLPGQCAASRAQGSVRHMTCLNVSFVALICWFGLSSLWIYPHSLSYFNESIGGPLNGPRHLLGSNIDWGQDLRYLSCWWDADSARNKQSTLFLCYDGQFNPAAIGLAATKDLADMLFPSKMSDNSQGRADETIGTPLREKISYQAISANLLYGMPSPARDGALYKGTASSKDIQQFRAYPTIARCGYSITVTAVKPDEIKPAW